MATNRRKFLQDVGTMAGAAAVSNADAATSALAPPEEKKAQPATGSGSGAAIDFRYAPLSHQTAFCFPDDPHKSLVSGRGELLCGHPGSDGKGLRFFPEVVRFSVAGMETDRVVKQSLESPGVPIVHTRIERPEGSVDLTTFATNLPEEGRVDNVILDVVPKTRHSTHAVAQVVIRSDNPTKLSEPERGGAVNIGDARLFMLADAPLTAEDCGNEKLYRLASGVATPHSPLRHLFRFPQEGQGVEKLQANLHQPEQLLGAARQYWKDWKPYGGAVGWNYPGRQGEFLQACARNILQARELKQGRLNFQVGPTVYRGLWVVDGNFLLEAARYLGYDAEAQQGLEATWGWQRADGGVFAAVQIEHWKDTGIAMFSLVRQAELSQDWSYFRQMQPNVLRAVKFLMNLQEKAQRDGGTMGHYGLLPPGFGDGGLGGIRSEFTNTLWVLAGLKAVTGAAAWLGMNGFEETEKFYQQLRASFFVAAREEMRQHPKGFSYLPMLMKDDPQWSAADEWDRPRPQIAQWALSHAIYPGLVFELNHPVVKGHIALMQACTQEDVPAETGWLPHEGLWNYNAAFVAHAYLWAGLPDWARRTFIGFLNHASPLYCWREEQPLRGSLASDYVGDMPHNWASAECVIFLRHMLALEDGSALRLLEGIGEFELSAGRPIQIAESPTRFGRVSMDLEPTGSGGWRLSFKRGKGPNPGTVALPGKLGSGLTFADVKGASFHPVGAKVMVQPDSLAWEAVWKA